MGTVRGEQVGVRVRMWRACVHASRRVARRLWRGVRRGVQRAAHNVNRYEDRTTRVSEPQRWGDLRRRRGEESAHIREDIVKVVLRDGLDGDIARLLGHPLAPHVEDELEEGGHREQALVQEVDLQKAHRARVLPLPQDDGGVADHLSRRHCHEQRARDDANRLRARPARRVEDLRVVVARHGREPVGHQQDALCKQVDSRIDERSEDDHRLRLDIDI